MASSLLLLPPTVSCGGSSTVQIPHQTTVCVSVSVCLSVCVCVCEQQGECDQYYIACSLVTNYYEEGVGILPVNMSPNCYYSRKWDGHLRQVHPHDCSVHLVFSSLWTRSASLPLYSHTLLKGAHLQL